MIGFTGFGRRVVATTGTEDVWGGTAAEIPLPPPEGIALEIVSTSAADASGGTGAQAVDITYLDVNGVEHDEKIVMNGVTPVPLTSLVRRIQDFHVVSVGSGLAAAGTINCRAVVGAVVYAVIGAGGNRSLATFRTVPAGYVYHLTGWHASARTAVASMRLRVTRDVGSGFSIYPVFLFYDILELSNASQAITFTVPIKIAALSDIKVSVAGAVGAIVSATFDGYLLPE